MDAFWFDILNLSIRWLHMIAGIAWIGASFYFVMLDNSLRPPKKEDDSERGVFGELWAVHGGGFYQSQKFLTGPKNEPLTENLHWSKWEAYTTWITGFSLFILLYWIKAEIYLIDPSVNPLTKTEAIFISLGFLVGGWVVYDLLCRSPLGRNNHLLSITIFVLLIPVTILLTDTFSGRGAFILFGAMLGTIMAANVFFVIIPGQKRMVNAIRAGEKPNPLDGARGKQRSVHNTYFTLPVLFTMISNHFAITYGHEYNWLILILISLGGALIRVFFVSRHTVLGSNHAAAIFGVFFLIAAIFFLDTTRPETSSVPSHPPANSSSPGNSTTTSTTAIADADKESLDQNFNRVFTIIQKRCTVCHAARPTYPGFAAPPNGVLLETTDQVKAKASLIHQQIVSRVMPLGNVTQMTEEEREAVRAWTEGK